MAKQKKPRRQKAVEVLVDAAWRLFQQQMLDSIPAKPANTSTKEEKFVIRLIMGRFTTENKGFASEVLASLGVLVNYASRPKVDRPLNILLAAAPGTGKSFLAKELAQALGRKLKEAAVGRQEVSFEEVHVAAFRTVDDLVAVLQRVQSENLKGKLPVVLFDEVDGQVDRNYLFASLLAPMCDGKFYVGSNSYAIGPAVFLFAASNLVSPPTLELFRREVPSVTPTSDSPIEYSAFAEAWRACARREVEAKGDTIAKCRDFMDRIDLLLCIPPVEPDLIGHDAVKQENASLILGWVLKHFPSVKRVEIAVVAALGEKLLKDKRSRRDVERSIFLARTPRTTTLSFGDLPEIDQRTYGNSQVVLASKGTFYTVATETAMGAK